MDLLDKQGQMQATSLLHGHGLLTAGRDYENLGEGISKRFSCRHMF